MLNSLLDKYEVILASASPRRQQLLKELNIPYTHKVLPVKEVYDAQLKGEEIPKKLALLKAGVFDAVLQEKELLITADTIVWFEDSALEKPKNKNEAFEMLKALSGKRHEVISAVCIKTKQFTEVITDTTQVCFSELSDAEIDYYIQNFAPYDKAGSYGIQEWIGLIGVEKIEGSYYNVMGLPVQKLYKLLKKYS